MKIFLLCLVVAALAAACGKKAGDAAADTLISLVSDAADLGAEATATTPGDATGTAADVTKVGE